ncbi:MAG: hypothetical protein A3E83_07990 [Gammaproteobacteria bacterium RIFCSPHIGHO2_12_FULL_41_20]|nr:MAG: hypothetical protein A3E83_07990 [Gammaproteobacteria bacterium RIFCSPHIGHO2_12_FULL_41_20]
MLVASLYKSESAYYFQIATQQLNNAMGRLQSVGDSAGVEEQIIIWNNENKKLLPYGRGVITGVFPVYTVSVYWGDKSIQDCSALVVGLSGCLRHVIKI